MKKAWLVLFALTLAACSRKDIDNKDAVKAAVVEYLSSRSKETGLDPQRMDIHVNAVAFERDTARATVSFTVKGTDAGMQLNYTLERSGNKWIVKSKDSTTGPHPLAEPQSGTPPAPPGAQGALPEGHPPLDSGSKK